MSDAECLKHFDALLVAIEIILDAKLVERERATKHARGAAAITAAAGSIAAPRRES